MVISDNYLKSENCMYEVMEVMRNREYLKALSFEMDCYFECENFWGDFENNLAFDDHVILCHFNKWKNHKDKVLSDLCQRFLNRRLFKSVSLDEYPEGYVDIMLKLREECDKAGLPYKYYLEEDTVCFEP